MRNRIFASAREIATEINASENSFDVALAKHARLVARLLDARLEAGVPARTGRIALERAVEAMTFAAQAREKIIDAHEELAGLDLREIAVGDLSECPNMARHLTVVENQSRAA